MADMNLQDLLYSVLARGACSTLKGHVLDWERFERWAANKSIVYPPSDALLVAYAAHRGQRCGPSVLPAFRAT
eukprot:4192485-Pyramimonas_sp.AAC.1